MHFIFLRHTLDSRGPWKPHTDGGTFSVPQDHIDVLSFIVPLCGRQFLWHLNTRERFSRSPWCWCLLLFYRERQWWDLSGRSGRGKKYPPERSFEISHGVEVDCANGRSQRSFWKVQDFLMFLQLFFLTPLWDLPRTLMQIRFLSYVPGVSKEPGHNPSMFPRLL